MAAHVVPARLDARGGGARLQIERAALHAEGKEQAVVVERQVLAPVEEAGAPQRLDREALAHLSHHAAVGAAREVGHARAPHGRLVNAAAREVADAFELILGAADFEEARADGAGGFGVERLEGFGLGGVGR